MGLLKKLFGSYSDKEVKRVKPIAQKVEDLESAYTAMSEAELRGTTAKLKARLEEGESVDDILPDAFAACREAAWRVLGMKHFPVQVIGGIILHQGRIAEMKTGEGKTLVATLPAYLNALLGRGVHIVTVNDYLAKRDSEWMGKVYRYLGLSVGLIVHGLSSEERRNAYACDITYGTNNELGFDYLRDNMVTYKQERVQRGHYYAIVDEVDSILIDEARTPLIISGQGDKSTELYDLTDRFVRTLKMAKVKELDSKEDADETIEGDYIVDEKARTATLTADGVAKAEAHFNLENLTDPDNITIAHHINQAIKANGVMHRDIDYVVKDGQVIIVDENTGRLMLGRRYNEGLHQAIEAKEKVKVERESKTLATITFQNFFRMYEKLAGMTGTALTEEGEFREIYNLDVVEIPTNRTVVRDDKHDLLYTNEKAKFRAVIEQIKDSHEKGQPVLVGTVSIERSEYLSKLLKKEGIKHEVLNAKFHEKEAEIVAQAGKFGAVTIATNMAGRGTDIVLGGNAEYMAKAKLKAMGVDEELLIEADGHSETDDEEILKVRQDFQELLKKYKGEIALEAEKVKEAGGLFIVGTERHESRRIDNQLRGRSGRQGDPGSTQFYISLEDDLIRLFGGEKVQERAKNIMETMMKRFKLSEDEPLEDPMLTNMVETAQRNIEGRHFGTRKNVLQFDDVMNKQREIIYGQRGMVLEGKDLQDVISKMMDDVVDKAVDQYLADPEVHDSWNLTGLREHFMGWITAKTDLHYVGEELEKVTKEDIRSFLKDRVHTLYKRQEETFGAEFFRELERSVLLRVVDTFWMDHIDAMDELKKGIGLRGYGQRDPVVEYRLEGFAMFDSMIESIQETTVKTLICLRLRKKEDAPPKRVQVAKPTSASHGDSSDGSIKKQPAKSTKVGRNDPCPCGSGKKYKKCCGA